MPSSSHDYVSGEVLTASRMDNHPQGCLAAATPITANVGPTSGTTELDVITAPAATVAATGRKLKITLCWRGATSSASAETFIMRIKEGATVLQEAHINSFSTGTGGNGGGGVLEAIVDSPSVASHTYKATIQRAIGAGTCTVTATATAPITLVVEDIGLA